MSGYTLSEIREALAKQLFDNLDRQTTVNAYEDNKVMPPPSITVVAAPTYIPEYWVTFGGAGLTHVSFILRLEAFKGTDVESAHRRRDDYLSAGTGNTSSIIDALMVDPTLGLANCTVGIGAVTVDDTDISAEIAIEVHIKKVGANA